MEHSLEGKEIEGADWRRTWEEARKKVIPRDTSTDSRRDDIWVWGLDHQSERAISEQISEVEVRKLAQDPQ